MIWPWEFNYIEFMNSHVRVSVTCADGKKEYFSVLDDGTSLNVDTVMPDGSPLIFRVEGHPRTTDRRTNVADLVNYVLTNYKR